MPLSVRSILRRPLARVAVGAAALATAVTGGTGLAVAPSAHAVVPASTIGVQWNAADSDYASMPSKMARLASLGVREIEMPVSWWYVCPTSSTSCDYAQLDRTISTARSNGMSVSLQVNGTPDWLHPDRAGDAPEIRRWMLPRDDAERGALQAFAQQLAGRYSGQIKRFEWGNEPDLWQYSTTGVSPDTYARSLAAFYRGVKAGSPGSLVVSAGISRSSEGFARQMIATLSSLPGASTSNGYFDQLGLHPYTDENSPLVHDPRKVYQTQFGMTDFNFDGYQRMKAMLDSVGRSGTSIWMSEFGYSTTATWMKAVPAQQRALYLAMAADMIRDDPRIDGLMWHVAYASTGAGSEWALLDDWGNGPAARALSAANSGRVARGTAGGCDAATLSGTVTWQPGCFGVDPSRVARTEVYVDGYPVAWNSGSVATWGSSAVGDGAHSVVVAYYDADGPIAYSSPRAVTVSQTGSNTWLTPGGTTVASTSAPITSGPLYTTVSSRTVTFDVTYQSTQPLNAQSLVVAVRDANGAAVDPQATGPTGAVLSYAYRATRSFAPGTYTATVSYLRDGRWQSTGVTRTFDIR